MLQVVKRIIRHFIISILEEELNRNGHNITYEMQLLARKQSAQYTMDHMQKCRIFNKKTSIIEYCLSRCPDEGMICEFGVYSGESVNYISSLTPEKEVHGFDSFDGLPEDWRPGFEREFFSLGGKIPSVNKNVKLHAGWYNDVLPEFCAKYQDNLSFLHIDCDLYSSTKTVFEYLGVRLKQGSIILFDEFYNYPGWQHHEFKAFIEFIETSGKSYEYLAYNDQHEQVAVIIQ